MRGEVKAGPLKKITFFEAQKKFRKKGCPLSSRGGEALVSGRTTKKNTFFAASLITIDLSCIVQDCLWPDYYSPFSVVNIPLCRAV